MWKSNTTDKTTKVKAAVAVETCSIFINKTGLKKRTDSVATTGKRGVDNSMRLARVV